MVQVEQLVLMVHRVQPEHQVLLEQAELLVLMEHLVMMVQVV